MSHLDELMEKCAELYTSKRKPSGVNLTDGEVRAMLAAHHVLHIPKNVVASAFGVSLWSAGRIFAGKTHRAIYEEYESYPVKQRFAERWVLPHHTKALHEAIASKGAPKPEPPRPLAVRFAGKWAAYGDEMEINLDPEVNDNLWYVFARGTSSAQGFASSQDAFEYGLVILRGWAFEDASEDSDYFEEKFKERPEWPRSEWLPSNWRRLSK